MSVPGSQLPSLALGRSADQRQSSSCFCRGDWRGDSRASGFSLRWINETPCDVTKQLSMEAGNASWLLRLRSNTNTSGRYGNRCSPRARPGDQRACAAGVPAPCTEVTEPRDKLGVVGGATEPRGTVSKCC